VSIVEQTERPEASDPTEAEAPRRRGWVSLYAAAFVLVLAAGISISASSLGKFRSIGLLRVSAGLSIAAMVLAVVAVVLPRRR
jgi:hypothetical protein